jgi:hypothetical protein
MLAAALAAMGCGAAQAQSAQQRYQGTFFVTDATDGCTAEDGSVVAQSNEHYVFVFRSENDLQAMSLFGQRRALAFVAEGKKFGKSGNFFGTYIPAGAVPRQAPGKYSQFKVAPSKLAGDTESIRVTGKLTGFEGFENCTVTFEAGGIRRPGF